jgi:phosphohistidine phosphatase
LKILGLFRHAKSDWHDPRARDFDRPLNARGRRGAALMGQHIIDHGIRWQRVLASPAVRVTETIDLSTRAARRPVAIDWDRRIYLASSASLLDVLREQDGEAGKGPASILIVGHNPSLEDLIFDLVPDDGTSPLRDRVEEKFPTAAYAVLELDVDRWEDVEDNCAKLVHLARPRDLDPELGPQAVD